MRWDHDIVYVYRAPVLKYPRAFETGRDLMWYRMNRYTCMLAIIDLLVTILEFKVDLEKLVLAYW